MKLSTAGIAWLAVGCILVSACAANHSLVGDSEVRSPIKSSSNLQSSGKYVGYVDRRAQMAGVKVIWINPPERTAVADQN